MDRSEMVGKREGWEDPKLDAVVVVVVVEEREEGDVVIFLVRPMTRELESDTKEKEWAK